VGEGPQDAAQLPHRRRGAGVVPDDAADDDGQLPVAPAERRPLHVHLHDQTEGEVVMAVGLYAGRRVISVISRIRQPRSALCRVGRPDGYWETWAEPRPGHRSEHRGSTPPPPGVRPAPS
jgi:hypothetical protein